MSLEVGRINHQLIRLTALGRQARKYPIEHAHPAPADKPVVDRFVRTIIRRGIALAQTVPDHEDDPTDNPPVIDPRHPLRQREIRLNPAYLRLGQPDQITLGNASPASTLNQNQAYL